jgi:hypothetical protein
MVQVAFFLSSFPNIIFNEASIGQVGGQKSMGQANITPMGSSL